MGLTLDQAKAALDNPKYPEYQSADGLLKLLSKVSAEVEGAPKDAITFFYSGSLQK